MAVIIPMKILKGFGIGIHWNGDQKSQMKLWEILVPTVVDRGLGELRPVRTRCHREWDERVRRITNGLSICPVIKGQWVSPNSVLFKERMIPVRIACTEEQMNKIVELTLDFYCQEAVMIYVVSEDVRIIYKEK